MPIKPILFNTEMVRAILDGRKSCTRRLVKTRRKDACGFYVTRKTDGSFAGIYEYDENESMFDSPLEPPYHPGDILYVRETWTEECGKYYYRANYDSDYLEPCETLSGGYPARCRNYAGCEGCTASSTRIYWHPSIHMPKEAARIFLQVTDVRVERLQEITETQAQAEGCNSGLLTGACTARGQFADLWDSTVKKSDLSRYGWDANPWVWVIEFERCEKVTEGEYGNT